MAVNLTFINQTVTPNAIDVVVFQKNQTPGFNDLPLAWKVIEGCAQGDTRALAYGEDFSVSAALADSGAARTDLLSAKPGERFEMKEERSDERLELSGSSAMPSVIEVVNGLEEGAIDVDVYRDGAPLSKSRNVVPAQDTAFAFEDKIWVGVVAEVQPGEVLNPLVLADINTEISLDGIASADIVVTGGGTGPEAMPYAFALTNVVKAG